MGGDQNRLGPLLFPFRQCTMNKRRPSAGRQPHQNIPLSHSPLLDRPPSRLGIIFRPLLRPKDRFWSTGQNRLHLLGRRVKGWGHLTRIQNAQTSAGPRSHIKKSTAFSQGLCHHVCRPGNLPSRLA